MNINLSNINGNDNNVTQNNEKGSSNRWYYVLASVIALITLLFAYIRDMEVINKFIINLLK